MTLARAGRLAQLWAGPTRGKLDLRDPQITSVLLDWPDDYRVRVVDEVTLGSAGLYGLRRSLQLEALQPLLSRQGVALPAGEVAAVLPLGVLPKAPLLDFEVSASNGQAVHMLDRETISRRQVQFLELRASGLGIDVSDTVLALLYGMSLFLPGMLDAPAQAGHEGVAAQTAVLLTGTYGTPFTGEQVERWMTRVSDEADLLRQASGERLDPQSSSGNPLLALVEAPLDGLRPADVDAVLDEWRAFLRALRDAGDLTTLGWIGTLGLRYVAMVELVMDPARPLRLTTKESRALPLRAEWTWNPWRGPARTYYCRLSLAMKEARSYHLRLRSDDESVTIRDVPLLTTLDKEPVGGAYFPGLSPSDDGYSLYTADVERPTQVSVRVPLRLSGDVRRALTLVATLTVAALVLACSPVHLDKAAVGTITLPATFAGTVLLVRERTTLSAKVLKVPKWSLVVLLLLLWGFALARVAGGYRSVSPAPPPTVTGPVTGPGRSATSGASVPPAGAPAPVATPRSPSAAPSVPPPGAPAGPSPTPITAASPTAAPPPGP